MMALFRKHQDTAEQQAASRVSSDQSTTAVDPEKHAPDVVPSHVETSDATVSSATKPIDPAIERSLIKKLDLRVTWLVAFLFLLSFLDRSNIGNAEIAGMERDLKLTGDKYDTLLTVFYVAYIVFQFQAFMWRILLPHTWCFIIVLVWGILATCQAAAQSWGGMVALRFLLGAAEAGFGPSVPFLLSFFYLRNEIGFRSGLFLSAAPLANTFAGALAYGITSAKHSKLAVWRLLFLVEGIPTILAAFLAWRFLPDGPSTAKFLTEEEKEVARLRTAKQHGKQAVAEDKGGVKWNEIGQTLLDAKAWFTALMYFSCNVSYASLPVFLPTILNEMGFEAVRAQGLTAPPYFLSFLVTIGSSYVADRTQQRGAMVIALSCLAGVGYIMLATTTGIGPRYAGTFLAASGVFPAIANILPWVVNNQGSTTRRGMGIVLLNMVGQCGPLLGTRLFPKADQPRYVVGQSVCAAFMFFNALLALGNRTLLAWENRKLDRKYGPIVPKSAAEKDEDEGSENYGRNYRYVL